MERHFVPIFVIHRVHETPLRPNLRPSGIERTLVSLRRSGRRFVSLSEVIADAAGERSLPDGAVVFTADDGYHDQAEVLAPIFERQECPLTIFLISGFLDRITVPWWDRIEHALVTTGRRRLTVEFNGMATDLRLDSHADKVAARHALVRRYRLTPADRAEEDVADLYQQLGLTEPRVPFGPYEPMTWSDARAIERRGLVTFGPHTVHHPILARAEPCVVRNEISESMARLRAELGAVVPAFCYPVGESNDFGDREVDFVRHAGFKAALTVGRTHAWLGDPEMKYRLERMPLTNDLNTTTFELARINLIRRRPSADDLT